MLKDIIVSLRSELIEMNGLINNSEQFQWYRDDSKTNFSINFDIWRLLYKYSKVAGDFGFRVFIRHHSCGNKNHYDYPHTDLTGTNIPFDPHKKSYDIYMSYEHKIKFKCPCSENNDYSAHNFFVLAQIENNELSEQDCRIFATLFSGLFNAIELSDTKRPRAAVREQILLLIMSLNDMILPQTVDEYIESFIHKDVSNDR
ncbi:hypothetical protein MTBLM1_80027 [Rhodospirillaceae bacterium LM-1]|nr:hypothetical protein MTBLM1_80027 [Rhodospirillaceae bacterium LM-1]